MFEASRLGRTRRPFNTPYLVPLRFGIDFLLTAEGLLREIGHVERTVAFLVFLSDRFIICVCMDRVKFEVEYSLSSLNSLIFNASPEVNKDERQNFLSQRLKFLHRLNLQTIP
jgi:hypothetical protein